MSFAMEVKQENQLHLNDLLFSQILDKKDYNFLDIKLDFPQIVEQQEHQNLNLLTNIRGKGRPKGQKNSIQKQKKVKKNVNYQNIRKGHWSLQQNKKYHWFLEIYNKHFICKQMRRLDKIFKTMASFIGTRQAQQCRSHHQKMQKKYHSFPSIIIYLRKLHYSSEDFSLVEEDMQKNQIKQNADFLNYKDLQDLQLMKKTPPTPSVVEEAKIDNILDQPQREIKFQQDIFNLLAQDYDCGLQLDNLLF